VGANCGGCAHIQAFQNLKSYAQSYVARSSCFPIEKAACSASSGSVKLCIEINVRHPRHLARRLQAPRCRHRQARRRRRARRLCKSRSAWQHAHLTRSSPAKSTRRASWACLRWLQSRLATASSRTLRASATRLFVNHTKIVNVFVTHWWWTCRKIYFYSSHPENRLRTLVIL
jgi:hypothetical protein